MTAAAARAPRDDRWVVVGAGSAGCVVANRLSTAPHRSVVLVEAGPDLRPGLVPPAIDGPDFFAALESPGRRFGELQAVRTASTPPRPYARGRGVGGSSAVNAMVALRGDPAVYERWGWHDVSSCWDALALPEETAADDELGAVDRALLAAAPDAVRAPLTRRGGRRVTSAEAYLWPVLDRPNLTVRPDAPVDRVVTHGGAAVGVRLADGNELRCDRVVLCAGAIHTPAILLRSGLSVPGVGAGLHDHPALPVLLRLVDGLEPSTLAVGSLLTRGDLQVLPMNHLGPTGPAGHGIAMVALMRPRSRTGSITLRSLDPADDPIVDLDLLSHPGDVDRLREGARLLRDLLATAPFRAIVAEAYVDEQGTTLDALDDEAIERWVRTACGDYVHASGSCAIGRTLDDDGRVLDTTGLYVADASAFPHVPDVNTHLPTTMLAERLVRRWT